MFTSNRRSKLLPKLVQILVSFLLIFDFINCFENDYQMDYDHQFRYSQEGLGHRYRGRPPIPQRFEQPRHGYHRFVRPDYESEDYGMNEYEQLDDRRHWREGRHWRERYSKNPINYGNIFEAENMLSKGLSALSGGCIDLIKPEFGTCIERMANKFDNKGDNKENQLGDNDCKALWDLMCCATELISKKCTNIDLKVIEAGFLTIQKTLEAQPCAKSLRSTVQCSKGGANT